MRSLRSLAAIIFLAVFPSVALADDVITNVMSPIVSYQYPDDFNTQALTNGGISSPIYSYQYLEWPGDDVLQLRSSPRVSYYYPGADGPLVNLQGRVTDASGVLLAGATIKVAFGSLPVAETTTDGGGHFVIALGAGVYALSANAPGYAMSSRVLTVNQGVPPQHFQLAALPAAPEQTPVTRSPEVNHTAGLMGELKVFDGSTFVPINEANKPQSDRMTIVMTHGFDSNPEAWARELAEKMWTQGVTSGVANILGWDWRAAARGPLIPSRLSLAHGHTGGQGIGLGQAMQDKLGEEYTKEIHFLGHSLGTLVNAATANYLQGIATGRQAVSPTPWMNAPMHMTLFDHAEIATLANLGVLFDGITITPSSAVKLYQAVATTLQAWSSPVPRRFAWLGNYVSLVGFYEPRGVNISLQKGAGEVFPVPVHIYPAYWYGLSVVNPSASALGHRRSHEYDLVRGGPFTFPPSESQIPSGASYRQIPAASDPLALELLPPGNPFEHFGILPQVAVQVTVSSIQFAADVTTEVRETTEAAAQRLASGFNYAAGIALQGGQMVMELSAPPVMRLWLRTHGIPLPSPLSLRNGTVAFNPASGGDPAPQPMAWLPIAFPPNATAMAFDFAVEGDPVDDVLVCGIGTNNLFSLEAKYIPTNAMSASRLIDVSAWAGATNELFFGFMGGTSTNAALIIENIRFYSVGAPRLEIVRDGTARHLSWSSTAGGYVVETTPTLAAPTWVAVTNAPMILGDRYVLADSSGDQTRFYRLRAR